MSFFDWRVHKRRLNGFPQFTTEPGLLVGDVREFFRLFR